MMKVAQSPGLAREWWIVAACATALTLLLVFDRTTQRLDAMLYDLVLRLDERAPDPSILLVSIDDESLTHVGAWPWSRDQQAQLLGAVQRGQPKAIAYDVQLIEASPEDAAVAAALRGSAPAFLPLGFDVPGHNGAPFDLLMPPPPIAAAAAGLGHVNVLPDADGIVRRVRLWDGNAERPVPQLMTLVAASLHGSKIDGSTASFVARPFPLSGPTGNYPTVPASAVLRGELPPELLHDRVVLIGAAAQGLADWHPTAARGSNGIMSGVELQANILDALLHDRMLVDAGTVWIALLALVALWAMLAGFRVLAPRGALGLLLLLQGGLIVIAAAALCWVRVWLPPATGGVMLLCLYPLWGWRRLSAANAFIAKELERLESEPEMLLLSPEGTPANEAIGRPAILLRNAITSLRVAQRQREDVIQFLSHDMRTPQASILALIDTATPTEISEALSVRIQGYARRTLELADNFVHFTRAEAKVFRLEPVDLPDIVIDALDDLWPLLQRRGLTVEIPGKESALLIEGDRPLLTRAVINLIHNAIKFSPQGGRICCRLDRINSASAAPLARLTVTDEGPGVPPSQEPSLFKRFERGAERREDQFRLGSGLGLAFVHAVASRHQGVIRYERIAGAGATFILSLPLLPADQTVPIGPNAPPA